jgi:hypothetical protein
VLIKKKEDNCMKKLVIFVLMFAFLAGVSPKRVEAVDLWEWLNFDPLAVGLLGCTAYVWDVFTAPKGWGKAWKFIASVPIAKLERQMLRQDGVKEMIDDLTGVKDAVFSFFSSKTPPPPSKED